MQDFPTQYPKVEMHWHFYGKCGVSASAIKYPGAPDSETMHYHDFHELVVVREGSGRHLFSNGSYPVFKGNVFVIRPGVPHGYAELRNLELVNVLFFPNRLLFPWENIGDNAGVRMLLDSAPGPDGNFVFHDPPRLNAEELDAVLPVLQDMLRERREKKADFEWAMNVGLMRLLFTLSRFCLGSKPVQAAAGTRLNQIIAFLAVNYSNPALQITEIARKHNLTVKTLERLFRKDARISPAAYLSALRLEHAAELLRFQPEFSVTEIAFCCGFSDVAYFSRVFRKKYAVSPRDFRKKYHQPEIVSASADRQP